ncbi:hypothetical protein CRM22_002834 [Opisthorchis felineus]|uniref:Uncharacterized protein n=1 Tax=Opisthorchis felineus TaxID=147828 RepID=A0A4S2M469_OPIFE|nr:hypothetical protein CRM22_002834 [Opisthorchis felineus]
MSRPSFIPLLRRRSRPDVQEPPPIGSLRLTSTDDRTIGSSLTNLSMAGATVPNDSRNLCDRKTGAQKHTVTQSGNVLGYDRRLQSKQRPTRVARKLNRSIENAWSFYGLRQSSERNEILTKPEKSGFSDTSKRANVSQKKDLSVPIFKGFSSITRKSSSSWNPFIRQACCTLRKQTTPFRPIPLPNFPRTSGDFPTPINRIRRYTDLGMRRCRLAHLTYSKRMR